MNLSSHRFPRVFSAHAEVVPQSPVQISDGVGILRARGGSSNWISCRIRLLMYSPRTRR